MLARLLDAGVADAWLTPILMKKGRPAHTLSVLVDAERPTRRGGWSSPRPRRSGCARPWSASGRWTVVPARSTSPASRCGSSSAELDGVVVNAQPEYDDVVAAAAALGRAGQGRARRGIAAAHSCSPARDGVDLAVAATTFALIFPVELPDKTFVASLVLATRYRPLRCGWASRSPSSCSAWSR